MNLITHLRSFGAVLLFLGLSVTSHAQIVVFGPDANPSTAEFSLGDSAVSNGSGFSASLSNVATGNPGDALQLEMDYTASAGNSFAAQFVKRDDWNYNPSTSGEIISFDFSADFNTTRNVAISIGALQGGNTFWTHLSLNQVISTNPPAFITVSFDDVTAGDFSAFSGSSGTLDFSDAGGDIVWGYFVRRGDGGSGFRDTDVVMDNISFTLTTVPEPTSGALILGGFTLLFLKRRRLNG